jgi:hypothetical protein
MITGIFVIIMTIVAPISTVAAVIILLVVAVTVSVPA